jgi:hypothetical protein
MSLYKTKNQKKYINSKVDEPERENPKQPICVCIIIMQVCSSWALRERARPHICNQSHNSFELPMTNSSLTHEDVGLLY